MNRAACFDAFLERHVNLNPDRIKRLEERTATIEKFLRDPARLGDQVQAVTPQGSFAQKTIIKPPEQDDTFDADVLLHLAQESSWRPKDYVAALSETFEASDLYREKADPGRRCVTIDYADEFHIDIVPFVRAENGDFITNAETDKWEQTAPEAFNEWLEEKDTVCDGRLVEVIRLAKYLREYSDVEFASPSVTLTLLLGQCAEQEAADAGAYADLAAAFESLIRALDTFLQENPSRPALPDPTCEGQNFHDRWDHADYTTCRSAIHTLVSLIDDARAAGSDAVEIVRWQKIFGSGFTVPADLAETEADREGEEDLQGKYGFPMRLTETVTVEAVERVQTARTRSLRRSKNKVDAFTKIEFSYRTSVEGPHEVYWKARNGGKAAAAAKCWRGEIRKGTMNGTREEPTKYRGQHSMQVFVVVDDVCVATAVRQVHIV